MSTPQPFDITKCKNLAPTEIEYLQTGKLQPHWKVGGIGPGGVITDFPNEMWLNRYFQDIRNRATTCQLQQAGAQIELSTASYNQMKSVAQAVFGDAWESTVGQWIRSIGVNTWGEGISGSGQDRTKYDDLVGRLKNNPDTPNNELIASVNLRGDELSMAAKAASQTTPVDPRILQLSLDVAALKSKQALPPPPVQVPAAPQTDIVSKAENSTVDKITVLSVRFV